VLETDDDLITKSAGTPAFTAPECCRAGVYGVHAYVGIVRVLFVYLRGHVGVFVCVCICACMAEDHVLDIFVHPHPHPHPPTYVYMYMHMHASMTRAGIHNALAHMHIVRIFSRATKHSCIHLHVLRYIFTLAAADWDLHAKNEPTHMHASTHSHACICMHVHEYLSTHTHTHKQTNKHTPTRTRAHTHTHTHTHTHAGAFHGKLADLWASGCTLYFFAHGRSGLYIYTFTCILVYRKI
jgi:hypothetical protein